MTQIRNVLITGATGFIGHHLIKYLHSSFSIYALTRDNNVSVDNAVEIFVNLSDTNFTKSLPDRIDCVIHLAQSSSYRDFPEGVKDMQEINVDSTVQLLEWARKNGVKHFIFASTANVYSSSSDILIESSTTDPTSFYGATKIAAEHLAKQYQQFFQVDILRFFTVYGPNQKDMLIPNIIERIQTGRVITLAKGAGIYLTPIFVGDVVHIINSLLMKIKSPTIRLFNICGDQVCSLADIVKIIEIKLNKKAYIHTTDHEPAFFVGSNDRIKRILGYKKFTDIQTGLESTIL